MKRYRIKVRRNKRKKMHILFLPTVLMYLVFLVISLMVSPTNAYFIDTVNIEGKIIADGSFGVEAQNGGNEQTSEKEKVEGGEKEESQNNSEEIDKTETENETEEKTSSTKNESDEEESESSVENGYENKVNEESESTENETKDLREAEEKENQPTTGEK